MGGGYLDAVKGVRGRERRRKTIFTTLHYDLNKMWHNIYFNVHWCSNYLNG